jgi:hypothetical protein
MGVGVFLDSVCLAVAGVTRSTAALRPRSGSGIRFKTTVDWFFLPADVDVDFEAVVLE